LIQTELLNTTASTLELQNIKQNDRMVMNGKLGRRWRVKQSKHIKITTSTFPSVKIAHFMIKIQTGYILNTSKTHWHWATQTGSALIHMMCIQEVHVLCFGWSLVILSWSLLQFSLSFLVNFWIVSILKYAVTAFTSCLYISACTVILSFHST